MNKFISFSFAAFFMVFTLSGFTQSEELGLASYYGDKFHGLKTAYGDTYDRNKYTCAHKRHKYGTKLKVTRIDNKKSVVVKVTDKGPFVKGRVIDLSYVAAEKIGLIQDGVTEVKVEVVGKEEKKETASSKSAKETASKKEVSKVVTETVKPDEYETKPVKKAVEPVTKAKEEKKEKVVSTSSNPATQGVFKIGTPSNAQEYAVQVASLNNYDNAAKQVESLKAKWFKNVMLLAEPKAEEVSYKVLMGPFESEEAAKRYKSSLSKKHKMNGFVVALPVESTTTAKGGEPTEASTANKAVVLEAPGQGEYGVQVASLGSFESALKQVDALKAKWFKNILVKIDGDVYKVILGPMPDEKAAKNYSSSLAKKHKIKGFVTAL